jgi:hypothetical protein
MPWTQWHCCGVVDGVEVYPPFLSSSLPHLFLFLFWGFDLAFDFGGKGGKAEGEEADAL